MIFYQVSLQETAKDGVAGLQSKFKYLNASIIDLQVVQPSRRKIENA